MKTDYSPSDLQKLIDLYFNGLTTLEQEQRLRDILADPSVTAPGADDVRAVMSFAAMTPAESAQSDGRRVPLWLRVSSVAASAAVIATAGFFMLNRPSAADGCLAYVDGVRVEDAGRIKEIVDSDLKLFGEASGDVSSDIEDDLLELSAAMNTANTSAL